MLRDWIRKANPAVSNSQLDHQLLLSGPPKIEQKADIVVNDQIVFQSNGRDTYFKRAALRKEGIWLENPVSSSYFYTVKWDYGDTNLVYDRMKPHQFVNHFPDTRELTTKQGITKNLNQVTDIETDVNSFFPRSYDLSDRREVDLWVQDFNQTAILNIIQKHCELFQHLLAKQPIGFQNSIQLFNNQSIQKRLQLKEKFSNI